MIFGKQKNFFFTLHCIFELLKLAKQFFMTYQNKALEVYFITAFIIVPMAF